MPKTSRDRFVEHHHEQWRALVAFALLCPPDQMEYQMKSLADRSGSPLSTLKRKVEAIRFCHNTGSPMDKIIESGQHKVLSLFNGRKKNGAPPEKQCFIRWRVPVTLAEAIKPTPGTIEENESLQTRLARIGKLETSEELWEFIKSFFDGFDDDFLKNHAGLGSWKDRCKRV